MSTTRFRRCLHRGARRGGSPVSVRSPILHLVFNRPDTTARVFDGDPGKAAARFERLYVAADGPRDIQAGRGRTLPEVVRRIATAVDWPCEVFTLFRDTQPRLQACGKFGYLRGSLNTRPGGHHPRRRLRSRPVVLSLLRSSCSSATPPRPACHVHGETTSSPAMEARRASYYFLRFVHIWGWATWRRAWTQLRRRDARLGVRARFKPAHAHLSGCAWIAGLLEVDLRPGFARRGRYLGLPVGICDVQARRSQRNAGGQSNQQYRLRC